MSKLKLYKHPVVQQFGEGRLTDTEINLMRIDSLINNLIEYDNEECSYNFLLANALNKLLEAKMLYVAWSEEEY